MSSPVDRADLPFILQYLDCAIGNIQEARYLFDKHARPSYSIDQRDRIITKICILEARVRHVAQRLNYSKRHIGCRIEEIHLVSEDPGIIQDLANITEEKVEVGISEHLHEAEVEVRRTEMDVADIAAGEPVEVPKFKISQWLEKLLSCMAQLKSEIRGTEENESRNESVGKTECGIFGCKYDLN